MPSCAAHFQFGQDVLSRLTPDIAEIVCAHKQTYDIGLQGPDIFFYYKPYRANEISKYGKQRHAQPASAMFTPILAHKREKAALAYLLGLVCHYALDRSCHPYVGGHSRNTAEHMAMEAAYDAHIIRRQGLSMDRHTLIPASGPDYKAMASLWPGMTAATVKRCVRAMRRYTRLLDHKTLLNFCEAAVHKTGAFDYMLLPDTIDERQAEYCLALDGFYEMALHECPRLIARAVDAMGTSGTCYDDFGLNHEGAHPNDQA
ncbi:MAG: zinc dependent phospholipase C family protein [Oscillospiraceae bacterium]